MDWENKDSLIISFRSSTLANEFLNMRFCTCHCLGPANFDTFFLVGMRRSSSFFSGTSNLMFFEADEGKTETQRHVGLEVDYGGNFFSPWMKLKNQWMCICSSVEFQIGNSIQHYTLYFNRLHRQRNNSDPCLVNQFEPVYWWNQRRTVLIECGSSSLMQLWVEKWDITHLRCNYPCWNIFKLSVIRKHTHNDIKT